MVTVGWSILLVHSKGGKPSTWMVSKQGFSFTPPLGVGQRFALIEPLDLMYNTNSKR